MGFSFWLSALCVCMDLCVCARRLREEKRVEIPDVRGFTRPWAVQHTNGKAELTDKLILLSLSVNL